MIRKIIGEATYEFENVEDLIKFEQKRATKKEEQQDKQVEAYNENESIEQEEKQKVVFIGRRKNKTSMYHGNLRRVVERMKQTGRCFAEEFYSIFGRVVGGSDYKIAREIGLSVKKRKSSKEINEQTASKAISRKQRKKMFRDKIKEAVEYAEAHKTNFQEAYIKIFGRIPGGADYRIARKCGLTRKYSHKRRKEKPTIYKAKKEDMRTIRWGFIHSRAKALCKQDNRMNYEQAKTIAIQEWENSKIKKAREHVFPKFTTINSDFNIILEAVAKNVINNRGAIRYNECCYTLGLEDAKQWHDFIAEFMQNSFAIATYFKVENKFKHIRNGHDYIKYE